MFNPYKELDLGCFPCTKRLIILVQALTIPTAVLILQGMEKDLDWHGIISGKSPFPKIDKKDSFFQGKFVNRSSFKGRIEIVTSMARGHMSFETLCVVALASFLTVSCVHLAGFCWSREKCFYKRSCRYLTYLIYAVGFCAHFCIAGMLSIITLKWDWQKYHRLQKDFNLGRRQLLIGSDNLLDSESLATICDICYNTLPQTLMHMMDFVSIYPQGRFLTVKIGDVWYFENDLTELGFCIDYPLKLLPIVLCTISAILCAIIPILNCTQVDNNALNKLKKVGPEDEANKKEKDLLDRQTYKQISIENF